jgi:hypothetical protein
MFTLPRRRGRAAVRPARALAAAAVVAALATPAAANMAAPPPPAKLTSVGAAGGPSALEVRDADLVIDCSAGADRCRMQVTYQLHNAGGAPAQGVAAFYAIDTDDVAVTVDGRPADHALAPADAGGFDAAVVARTDGAADDLARWGERVSRHGVALELPAGFDAAVVVTGTLRPQDRRRYYLGMPAAPARHRLFVRGGRSDRRVGLRYFVAPIRTWSGFPAAMSFTLVHPAGWDAMVAGVGERSAATASGVTTVRGRIATDEPAIDIELQVSARTPIHGGALLAVGGHVDDATGLRLRAGVEAGRGAYLGSLAIELERAEDVDTGVVLVPAITVGSPWVLIVPSIGLGVGVPIRARPTTAIGGRFSADAQFGPLGLLMALDYYPGMDADPRRFTVSLLGQVAL